MARACIGRNYAHQLLKDGDAFRISNIEFAVIHTPAHTPKWAEKNVAEAVESGLARPSEFRTQVKKALRKASRSKSLRRWKPNLLRKSEEFERADDNPTSIDLPPLESVPCTRRERVMIVVPTFTERENAEDRIVAAVVT